MFLQLRFWWLGWRVRRQSVRALATLVGLRVHRRAALALVSEALDAPAAAGWRAPLITALGEMQDASTVGVICRALAHHAEPGVCAAVESALPRLRPTGATRDAVLAALPEYLGAEAACRTLVRVLGVIGDGRAGDRLVALLREHPTLGDVPIEAARALVQLPGSDKPQRLLALLHTNTCDLPAQIAMVRALREMGSATAIETLVLLLCDADELLAHHAAEALDWLGWQPPGPELAAQRAIALGRWDAATEYGSAAVPLLLAKLGTQTGADRVLAIREALGTIQDPRVIAHFETLLDARLGQTVCHLAANTLVQLAGPQAVAPLATFIPNADAEGIEILSGLLAERGEEAPDEALLCVVQNAHELWPALHRLAAAKLRLRQYLRQQRERDEAIERFVASVVEQGAFWLVSTDEEPFSAWDLEFNVPVLLMWSSPSAARIAALVLREEAVVEMELSELLRAEPGQPLGGDLGLDWPLSEKCGPVLKAEELRRRVDERLNAPRFGL